MNLESIFVITIQYCSETVLTAPGLGSVGESLCLQLSGADPVHSTAATQQHFTCQTA